MWGVEEKFIVPVVIVVVVILAAVALIYKAQQARVCKKSCLEQEYDDFEYTLIYGCSCMDNLP